jgi:hypothetical protein
MAEAVPAVPAIMPAPATMAKAVVAILSLSIALLDLFLVSSCRPQHHRWSGVSRH